MAKKIFDADYIVTRPFGFKDAYYTQFGFLGHEGCDFVPNSSQQAGSNIYSVCDGEIVRDTDDISEDPNWGAYGKKVIVWNKDKKIAFWYCHLQSNSVKLGQQVKEGDLIGKMGNTSIPGNNFGAHLHMNMCNTDDNGARINQDNGYKGFVDPLPFVQAGGDQPSTINLPSATFEELVRKSTRYDEFNREGFVTVQDVLSKISSMSQSIEDFSRQKDEWERMSKHYQDFMADIAKELNVASDEADIIKTINGLVTGEADCQDVRQNLLDTQKSLSETKSQLEESGKTTNSLTKANGDLSKSLQSVTERAEKAEEIVKNWNQKKDEILVWSKTILGLIIKVFKKNGGEN